MKKEAQPIQQNEWSVYRSESGFSINDIPSDEGNITMQIFGMDDICLKMKGVDDKGNYVLVPLNAMRFRMSGADMERVTMALGFGVQGLLNNDTKELKKFLKEKPNRYFVGATNAVAQEGRVDDDFALKVSGLMGDEINDHGESTMDIEVLKVGDVRVAIQETGYDALEGHTAMMLFKTAENGGKTPIMAEIFSGIATVVAQEIELGANKNRKYEFHA